MILAASKLLKIFATIVILIVEFKFIGKKLSQRERVSVVLVSIVCAFIANAVSGFFPSMTDEVRITALGEKSKQATNSEVLLSGYTVDGKTYISGTDLQIKDGHWFWIGEKYSWRPESDMRQPEDVTKSITVSIPVGWGRTLDFAGNVYRGKAEISTKDGDYIVDTYAETDEIIHAKVGRSSSADLILNQIYLDAVYVGIFLVLSLGAFSFPAFVLNNAAIRKKYQGNFIYAGIAITAFVIMLHYSGRFSFWTDELYQVAFTKGSLREALMYCVNMDEVSPPLSLLCATVIYHILPYGETWLLLFPMMLTAVSIYLIGITGKRVYGVSCGTLASIFMACHIIMWDGVAFEYRAYPLLVTLAVLSLYCFVRRNEEPHSVKWMALFCLSLTGMAMTHYFGILLCVEYFLADLYLYIRKNITFKTGVVSYALPGCSSIAWMLIIKRASAKFESAPHAIPNLLDVQNMLRYIAGWFELSYWVLILGLSAPIVYMIVRAAGKRKEKIEWKWFYQAMLSVMIIGTMAGLIVYGQLSEAKSTIWTDRYFRIYIPNACILSAFVVDSFMNHLKSDRITKSTNLSLNSIACGFFAMILSLYCLGRVCVETSSMPYREAADYIYSMGNDIFKDDTVIVSTCVPLVEEGWDEYYITRQGRRDPLNTISQDELDIDDMTKYRRVILQYNHYEILPELQSTLDTHYLLETDRMDLKVRTYIRNDA